MKENLLPYYPSYYINEDGTEVYRKNSFISSKGKIYQIRHPDYTANEIAKKFSTGRCMVFKIKKKYGS